MSMGSGCFPCLKMKHLGRVWAVKGKGAADFQRVAAHAHSCSVAALVSACWGWFGCAGV